MSTFFERLESASARKGMSVSAVAESIGLNRASATKWRNGGKASNPTLKSLAKVLDCDLDWLKTGASNNKIQEPLPADEKGPKNALINPSHVTIQIIDILQEYEQNGIELPPETVDEFKTYLKFKLNNTNPKNKPQVSQHLKRLAGNEEY